MRFHKERIEATTKTNVQKLKPSEDDDLPVLITRRETAG